MSKRTLLMLVALIASLALVATGTLAYLTDTDSDVNVMTLGNVDIEQIELQRTEDFIKTDGHTGLLEEGDLEPFVDGKPLYPAYPVNNQGSDYTAEPSNLLYWGPYVTAESDGTTDGAGNGLWNDEKLVGAVDKMVFVQNTGSSPAYYRTLIAFECPEGVEYSEGSDKQLMMNTNLNNRFQWKELGYDILPDGQRYLFMCATYQNALESGEISRPSLLQVVMTHNATNETVAAMGETYEILALSQAVQVQNLEKLGAEGALDAAFGPADLTNAKLWFSEMEGLPVTTASTAEELTAALANGGTVVLTDDVDMGTEDVVIPAGTEVDLVLGGFTLSGTDDEATTTAFIINRGTLKISGEGTIDYKSTGAAGQAKYGFYTIDNYGDLTVEGDVVIKNSTEDVWVDGSMNKTAFAIDHKGGSLTINGGTIESEGRSVRISNYSGGAELNAQINGGTFVGQVWLQGQNKGVVTLTVNGGEFGPVGGDGSSIFVTNSLGNNIVAINDGLFNTKIGASVATPMINGGTFASQDAVDKTNSALFAEGYTPVVK